jgi:predicted RNA methylase
MKVTGIDAERRWSESMPAAYEQYLVPVVFRPFAEDLAARAAALHPRRVLELAAGTGVLTRS